MPEQNNYQKHCIKVFLMRYGIHGGLRSLAAQKFPYPTGSGSTMFKFNNVVSGLAFSPSFLGRGLIYSTNLPFKVQAIPGLESTAHVIKSRVGFSTTSEKKATCSEIKIPGIQRLAVLIFGLKWGSYWPAGPWPRIRRQAVPEVESTGKTSIPALSASPSPHGLIPA